MNCLAERIAKSIAAGELREAPTKLEVSRESFLRDILIPYEDLFDGYTGGSGYSHSTKPLPRPRFKPQRKQSRRPLLLPPTPTFNPGRRIDPDVWKGLKAIWDFCLERKAVSENLLEKPLLAGIDSLAEAIGSELSDYWPMAAFFEDWDSQTILTEMGSISIYLPCFSYEEEGYWGREAFLAGPEAVAALLESVLSDMAEVEEKRENFNSEDLALISGIGWVKLMEHYAQTSLEKSYDLNKLADFGDSFFKVAMSERSWELMELYDPPIIDGGGGYDQLPIYDKEHIVFALEFSEAFYAMTDAMPPHGIEWDEEDAATDLIREVLHIWREDHKKSGDAPLKAKEAA